MEFLFFILLIMIFFALFSVHKGDDGAIRITSSSTFIDFLHIYDVQQALATILGSILIGFVAIPLVYIFLIVIIKRKMHKNNNKSLVS
jgi:hypothetical protein